MSEMDLLCCERTFDCRAYEDPVLVNDDRVLRNLLKTEELYTPSSSYFDCQTEITPPMRTILADWLLEVCEETKRQDEVFPLAMNFVDRFLSLCDMPKIELQLLGCVCLLIASKIRESNPLTPHALIDYADNSIELHALLQLELMVSTKLKWNLSVVTPNDFLIHLMQKLNVDSSMAKEHAKTFISLAAREHKFNAYTASMLASASLAAALKGIRYTSEECTVDDILHRLHKILNIEKDYLVNCYYQIEAMVQRTIESARRYVSENPPSKSDTPTDVRDIDF